MKNLILSIAAGLFILTSCSVDEPIETIQDQSLETMYVLNQMDGSSSLEAVASYGSPIENITYDGVPDLPHTEGYFKPPQKDAMSITWDGTQIGNDKSGGAEIKQDALNSSFSFKLVTECVTVDG
ncbi:MAG: hypothetical protein KJO77_04015, partial [Bacteroidia bacterium]|nr:hypothetical protein [Bacteroidia bacterium]